MSKITRFIGEYSFLSNFYESVIFLGKDKFQSVEHAYQALKSVDDEDYNKIRLAKTPGEAKKLGRSIKIKNNWDNIKVDIMKMLLIKKFENPFLADLLLKTNDAELIEENHWNDKFWGVCRGEGKNMLGILLMEIRNKIKNERNLEKDYFNNRTQ